ncbi:MAG: 4-alpha-glucanotransferase [Rhodocyclaceae bacterium]|nr:4-alpha-glucanotransferase [Rhodocyclaceae bacterium]
MTDDLKTLANRCGIADAYHDIWGGHHATSTYTRQALLAAMHFAPEAVADAPADLIKTIEAAEHQRVLPPVLVVRAGEPIRILHALQNWHWTLVLETGVTTSPPREPRFAQPSPQGAEKHLGRPGVFLHGQCPPTGELELSPIETLGYHRIEFRRDAITHSMPLIVVPQRCHQPVAIQEGGRIWGLTVQLYGVRSARNWGIGDFTDLGDLLALTAAVGGDLVGVNPLHALFPDNPAHISPYSPSQRGFVNVLYLDVAAVAELSSCAEAKRRLASADFQKRLQALRESEMVDYVQVSRAKFEILEILFAHSLANPNEHNAAFAAWRAAQGDELEHHARFEALQAHFRAADANIWGWPAWPEDYRDPDSPAVATFAHEHAAAVTYHAWLQWLADTQLAAAARRAEQCGMAVGVYQDLAVGANPNGAEVWNWQEVFAADAHAGAPPDEINLMGQDWGLPPFVPHRLRDAAYVPFIDILRANMKHAGALRIDHVMGLLRMFWVPADIPATEGAYVHYPFEDILGIVALESQRNQCLVIGEDLGTVPDGFRPRLAECGVLSYHPLIFERYPDGNFRLPADVSRQALVAAGTHDLPTLRGFWHGTDLEIRAALHLFPSEELRQRLITERDWDRDRLLWALEQENLLPAGVSKQSAALPELAAPVVTAIHAYLARTPAQIMVVQPEDIFGVLEQPNLPGTLEHQHPNWQRKLPLPLENWAGFASFTELVTAVHAARQPAEPCT